MYHGSAFLQGLGRRPKLMFRLLWVCFFISLACQAETISDVSQLQSFSVMGIEEPRSIVELQKRIKTTHAPISIAGSRCSQGGQIAATNGIVVDLKYLHAITVDVDALTVTAQADATWY